MVRNWRKLSSRLSATLAPAWQLGYQFTRLDFQGMGEAGDIEERRVAFAPFDGADIGTMEPGEAREPLLGEAQRDPALLASCPRTRFDFLAARLL